jgi:hypothetical protein
MTYKDYYLYCESSLVYYSYIWCLRIFMLYKCHGNPNRWVTRSSRAQKQKWYLEKPYLAWSFQNSRKFPLMKVHYNIFYRRISNEWIFWCHLTNTLWNFHMNWPGIGRFWERISSQIETNQRSNNAMHDFIMWAFNLSMWPQQIFYWDSWEDNFNYFFWQT